MIPLTVARKHLRVAQSAFVDLNVWSPQQASARSQRNRQQQAPQQMPETPTGLRTTVFGAPIDGSAANPRVTIPRAESRHRAKPRIPKRGRCFLAAFALLALCLQGGCAHEDSRRRARWLGRVGAGLAVGGGVTWALGQGQDLEAAETGGAISALVGAAMMLGAGITLASVVSCEADAECPTGQACKEVPAAAGRFPYAQCVPR